MSAAPTRVTLLQRLRLGQDEPAWEEFASLYRPYIVAILVKLRVDHHDAQDLAQEVLLRAWKALPSYEYRAGSCRFRTWLGLICRNALYNDIRHRNAKSRQGLDSADLPAANLPEIEAIAEKEWQLHISALAWKNVRGRFAETVQQCFLLSAQGLSSAEIAARLGLADSSVRVNKQRLASALCKEIVRLDSDLDLPPE